MCQMSVKIERDGEVETVMEGVSTLEAINGGVKITALFEEPVTIKGVHVRKIDFMGGTVTLESDA